MNLLPCPYCGFFPLSVGRDERTKIVACRNEHCKVQPSFGSSEIDAGEVWNTRADCWRPIEEGPEDGTHVLLYDGDRGCAVEGFHALGEWISFRGFDVIKATHFMPLPNPPKQ